MRFARQSAPCLSSRIISGCSTISCRIACTWCLTGGLRALAALNSRWSLNAPATPSSAAKRQRKDRPMDLPVQQFRTKAEQGFLDIFSEVEKSLPGNDWAAKLRRKAIQAFGSLGLPHRRIEAWKYTDLRTRLTEAYAPNLKVPTKALSETALAGALGKPIAKLPAYRIVIVAGALQPELSDLAGLSAQGVEVLALAEALEKPPVWLKAHLGKIKPQNDDAVGGLNLALMTGGIVFKIGKGSTLDKPVHLIHLADNREPASAYTRHLVVVEEGASLDLLESYASLGSAPSLRNAVTEALVSDNASLNHVKLQIEAADTTHLSTWLI